MPPGTDATLVPTTQRPWPMYTGVARNPPSGSGSPPMSPVYIANRPVPPLPLPLALPLAATEPSGPRSKSPPARWNPPLEPSAGTLPSTGARARRGVLQLTPQQSRRRVLHPGRKTTHPCARAAHPLSTLLFPVSCSSMDRPHHPSGRLHGVSRPPRGAVPAPPSKPLSLACRGRYPAVQPPSARPFSAPWSTLEPCRSPTPLQLALNTASSLLHETGLIHHHL
ncbi:hypothetical protein EDB80DRAFT_811496 [Ilyonectria destructans]|nr:hypothetical protein EDB80DRAFT_811496 [Ilyonectria destructans]